MLRRVLRGLRDGAHASRQLLPEQCVGAWRRGPLAPAAAAWIMQCWEWRGSDFEGIKNQNCDAVRGRKGGRVEEREAHNEQGWTQGLMRPPARLLVVL